MKQVYINSIASISAQNTANNSVFLDEIIDYEDNVIFVINPEYKDYIPPAAARRMAKGIKISIVASKIALREAGLDHVDAIITGTGMGCLRDSEKFLSAIMENNEQFLTPTSFIQSTHNTVGGQIALELQCKGYNFTYVHASNSFESALMDAKLQLQLDEAQNILVGGVDELGDYTSDIHKLIYHIKSEKVKSSQLLKSKTKGAVFGEGANFFVVSNQKQAGYYAEILDVKIYNSLDKTALSEAAKAFLKTHSLVPNDIDAIVLGYNGDVDYDTYYDVLTSELFQDTQQVYYKHLSGEFNTASSFGVWLACKFMKNQFLPKAVKRNSKSKTFVNVLLYNQYRGENHSFVLLRRW